MREFTKGQQKMLEDLRQRIFLQANGMENGWITLKLPYDRKLGKARTIGVARIPFERWMAHTQWHREEEWECQSPHGLKLQMDDRNHSDWWISSGLPIEICYIHETDFEYDRKNEQHRLAIRLNKAAWDYRWAHSQKNGFVYLIKPRKKEIEGRVYHLRTLKDMEKFIEDCEFSRRPNVTGTKGHIAVIARATSAFDMIVRWADAIITQEGSKVAHLVTVAREQGNVPVILHPKAFEEFFNYERITIRGDEISRCL